MDKVAERQYRHLAKKGHYSSILPSKKIRIRRWKYARPHKGYGWFAGHNSWYALRGFSGWITDHQETLLQYLFRHYKPVILATTIIVSLFLLPLGVGYAFIPSELPNCSGVRPPEPGAPCQDPTTLIWQRLATDPLASVSDFNLGGVGIGPVSPCDSPATFDCLRLTAGTSPLNTSVAITKRPIGDLSVAFGKTLGIIASYQFSNAGNLDANAAHNWGWFITTNGTAPQHDIGTSTPYHPEDDPSVLVLTQVYCASGNCSTQTVGSTTFSTSVLLLKHPGTGDTISSENNGCNSGGSCLKSLASTQAGGCLQSPCHAANTLNPLGVYLNFTGSTTNNTTCNVTANLFLGAGCSWIFNFMANTTVVTGSGAAGTPVLPANQLTAGGPFYMGFYSTVPNSVHIDWAFDPGPAIFIGGNTGMDAFAYVPNPNCNAPSSTNGNVCPNFDTGGFLGSAFNHYINGWSQLCQGLGITSFCASIYTSSSNLAGSLGTEVLNGLLAAGSAILSALSFFEGIVTTVLNAVGVAFGFPSSPGLGDDVITFINSVITLFTVQVPNAFAQIGPIFNGWINSLVIVFTTGVIGQIFAFLSSILTFGANIIVFAFSLFTTGLQWTTLTAPFWLFIWFFGFNADEGMNGWIKWFDFAKWLAFDIGVKFVTNVINWAIDVITAAMALLPKPFIQIAGKFPRLPIIEIHGSFSVPDFDGRALREGNLFAILGMLFGFMGFVWYELTQSSIPGTLANQFAGQPFIQGATTAIVFYKLFLPMAVLMVFLLMIPTLFTSVFGVIVPGPSVGFPKVRGTGPSRGVRFTGGSGRLFRKREAGKRSQAFIQRRLAKSEETKPVKLRNQREEEAREKAENERLSREQEQEEARKLEAQRGREAEASVKRNEAAKQKALDEQKLASERRIRSEEERFS